MVISKMKFYETINQEDVETYGGRKDSKNKMNPFHTTLKTTIKSSQYNEIEKIQAFMKRNHGITFHKSDFMRIAISHLLDSFESEEEWNKLLIKYNF